MRNYGYLYLKDDEVQRVVRLWRLNLYRTDVSETLGEWGATLGAGACPRRNRPRAGHSGAEGSSPGSGRRVWPESRGGVGGRKTEILEN